MREQVELAIYMYLRLENAGAYFVGDFTRTGKCRSRGGPRGLKQNIHRA